MFTKHLYLSFGFLLIFNNSFCQNIPRKAWFGCKTIAVTDSLQKALKLPTQKGVLVIDVSDKSSTKVAGLQVNDVITNVNGIIITSPQTFADAPLRNFLENQPLIITIIRSGKIEKINGAAIAKEKEKNDSIEYTYATVPYQNGYLGAIISKPKKEVIPTLQKKLPAILFVQGYTCADMVDIPTNHPYKHLCDDLTKAGYIVMRVEKPGMGFSRNTPSCNEINYPQEVAAFEAALLALQKNNEVDANNIFIWGHSLGGIVAPSLTAKHKWVKGSIVYGTLAQVWGEYYVKMIREQGKGFGKNPLDIEQAIRAARIIIQKTHIEKQSISKTAKDAPWLVPYLKEDFGWNTKTEQLNTRSLAYFQTLDATNTMANWAASNCHVLSMFGEADMEVLDSAGAQDIANTVNLYFPKKATYFKMAGSDHSFGKFGTMADGYTARALTNYSTLVREKYNPEIAMATNAWIQNILDTTISFQKRLKLLINPFEWKKLNTDAYKGKQDDIFFADAKNGWYGNGSGKIYRTTDSGTNWQKVMDKEGFYVRCLAFLDSLHGFVGNVGTDYFPGVTDTTCMLETVDGGISWKPVTAIEGPYPKGLCAFDVYKKLTINAGNPNYVNTIRAAGRVGGPAFLLTSTNNGKTWKSENLTSQTAMIFDIKFVSEKVGFICGASNEETEKSNALILKTIDGGTTWKKVYQSNRPFELTWKCSFPSEKVGYVTIQNYNTDEATAQRYIAKTTDGGDTWQELPLDKDLAVRQFGVLFANEKLGWVGTTTGGYQTRDGGATWLKTNLGKYTNKFRIMPTPTGKKVVGIGAEVWQLQLPFSSF